jgi:hypothetical protein
MASYPLDVNRSSAQSGLLRWPTLHGNACPDEAIMFIPTEIIVIASLALSLLLTAGVWSALTAEVQG